MKSVKLTKEQRRRRNLRRSAYGCFIGAAVLIVITFGLTIPQVQKSLADINAWFVSLELFIARYESYPAFFLLIFLFALKSFVPLIPQSVLFIASGMVFSEVTAFFINALGVAVLYSLKFLWGKKKGGGGVHKLANRSQAVYRFMDFGGKGNRWMLALMRFVPFFPTNTVSRAYGGTEMKLDSYLAFSMLGFLPRLVLWSFISFSIFDPFSVEFMTPIIILLIISGISLLLVNVLLERKDASNEKE
ncbi:MAG: TVP38/TMEM64 family protein [Clostridia bacterium]|nr:TVP38/TMEM64 family protein [Clostridia bacterium]